MAALNVTPEQLRRAYTRRPLRLLKVPLFWSLVVACCWAATRAWESHRGLGVVVGLAAGFVVGSLVRGLGSVGHDAAHGCVSRNPLVAYVVGFVSWAATMMSYTLYRAYHLDHHRIVGMVHDVDRVQVHRFTSDETRGRMLRMAIYLGGYPSYWAREVKRYYRALPPALRLRVWVELAVIFSAMGAAIVPMGIVPWLLVFGTQAVVGAFFASITSMAEHFDVPYHPDYAYTSRTYAIDSPLIDFLWSGTNFHLEHHTYPGIPYYNLRAFHFEVAPNYPDEAKANLRKDFWPLITSLWARAWTLSLAEERATSERDAARIGTTEAAEIRAHAESLAEQVHVAAVAAPSPA